MLKRELEAKFGAVESIEKDGETFFLFSISALKDCRVLMTSDLHLYSMNNAESTKHKYLELYFELPSYWSEKDLEDSENSWVFSILSRLKNHVVEKNTWFGDGHTMQANEKNKSIASNMKQNYLMLSEPIHLSEYLKSFSIGTQNIEFLAIIPIFRQEFQYKQAYGTDKLREVFEEREVTERLDEFRQNLVKSRWRRVFG